MKPSALVFYGTSHGQTAKIAQHLAQSLRDLGWRAEIVEGGHGREVLDPADYDLVLVGGSVHAGKHQRCVRRFVRRHRDALEAVPSGFFSVSMAAVKPGRAIARDTAERFLAGVEWHPRVVGLFAGALAYRRYGLLLRLIMRSISKKQGDETDTSRDHEYTSWDEVAAFARDAAALARPPGRAPGSAAVSRNLVRTEVAPAGAPRGAG